MRKQLTDKQLIENFIRELDVRGYNFFILKGIRSLLRQEKRTARCPKCGETILGSEDYLCARCTGE